MQDHDTSGINAKMWHDLTIFLVSFMSLTLFLKTTQKQHIANV